MGGMVNEERAIERVKVLRDKGYNCAQAVACTFAEVVNLEERLLWRLSQGFGGGMGGYEGTCGALSGAIMVLSYLNSNQKSKEEVYAIVKELFDQFEEHFGTTVCKGLKEEELCSECIEMGVRFAERLIKRGTP
jgi:C_GCAxxG_C_C family probable redox protein